MRLWDLGSSGGLGGDIVTRYALRYPSSLRSYLAGLRVRKRGLGISCGGCMSRRGVECSVEYPTSTDRGPHFESPPHRVVTKLTREQEK
jgi:hypothetical protein